MFRPVCVVSPLACRLPPPPDPMPRAAGCARPCGMMAPLSLTLLLLLRPLPLRFAAGSEGRHRVGTVPHSLTCDWQSSPSLGVSSLPVLGWVVPPCDQRSNAMQTSYRLEFFEDSSGARVWDSGLIRSNSSVAVPYAGPPLDDGAVYRWRVTTSTSGGCGLSRPSVEALLITALRNWHASASWIGLGNRSSTFNLVRRVVHVLPKAQMGRAVAFITAQNSWGGMLMNYKLWVGDKLVSVGPGRGEAPITGGDGRFRSQPFNTVDLTPFLPEAGGPITLALQTMQFSGFNPNTGPFPFPCAAGVECNGPAQISKGPAVLMQIDVHPRGRPKITWVTKDAAGWKVLNGDTWMRPAIRAKVCFNPGCGAGSGTGRVEHTDARQEPVGWRRPDFDDSGWKPAVSISTPSLTKFELTPRMAGEPTVAPLNW